MNQHFSAYKKLRDSIDKRVKELEKEHKSHLKCKAGCDLCCMDYNIFPIEFYSILHALQEKKQLPQVAAKNDASACIFLNSHCCAIYDERPIICRTHGLPLLFMNEESQWELSACELNFTEFDMEDFSEENTFSQDKFNSKLFLLNKKFISAYKQTKYGEFDLLPVKDLLKHF
ncbi:YkgJ family cysteine cluster protein [uncultured Draconibacterium sp.]|uniref:YkgJ family cysteine cluster protein n=1 Tax=uncultured Draconibacterium sp. TaxID=1573823 RepID=UPI0025FD4660|nr:YkgJ family cysteine cluster protein [uncultured Draconibacterium sp.]